MKKEIRAIPERAAAALDQFFHFEASSGLILIAAAALAMLFANTPLDTYYDAVLGVDVEVRVGTLQIDKPLLLWINDGLMAIFFLMVALEIKREVLQGQLSSREQLVLPLACAAGGVIVPALIYVAFNHADADAMDGWAIPAATDIAFALGILSLLGSRAPLSLKVLLSAIAVIDDLAAIAIIAMFYTANLSATALFGALLCLAGMLLMNWLGVRRISAYVLLGICMWVFVLKSGVHATLAGVAIGLTIPMSTPDDDQDSDSPLEMLEGALHYWVAFAILPLFAFANAGLSLRGIGLEQILHPVSAGIALGLLLGKPIGVIGAAWLAITLGLTRRPADISWMMIVGMGLLCGIGFTMSLFIGSLAFEHGSRIYAEGNRLGILIGSSLAAIAGYLLLRFSLPRNAQ